MLPTEMETLSHKQIGALLQPYLSEQVALELCEKVGRYLELLAHWSAKVSLTSIRDPEQIVQRHFGESFFLAEHLPDAETLLDFGSGAGFPGIPTALLRPDLQVTLSESQGRKASFLREAVAELGLKATVWADRVEKMPKSCAFDVVALRAVDRMDAALHLALERIAPCGTLAFLAGKSTPSIPKPERWRVKKVQIPHSSGHLVIAVRHG